MRREIRHRPPNGRAEMKAPVSRRRAKGHCERLAPASPSSLGDGATARASQPAAAARRVHRLVDHNDARRRRCPHAPQREHAAGWTGWSERGVGPNPYRLPNAEVARERARPPPRAGRTSLLLAEERRERLHSLRADLIEASREEAGCGGVGRAERPTAMRLSFSFVMLALGRASDDAAR